MCSRPVTPCGGITPHTSFATLQRQKPPKLTATQDVPYGILKSRLQLVWEGDEIFPRWAEYGKPRGRKTPQVGERVKVLLPPPRNLRRERDALRCLHNRHAEQEYGGKVGNPKMD